MTELLGVAMLLGWLALPLLALVAHRASEPNSRQRALALALLSAAALLVVPWIRSWTAHATALCFSKQTISAALSFAPSQYVLDSASPSVWSLAGIAAAILIAAGAVRILVLSLRLRRMVAASEPAPEVEPRAWDLAKSHGIVAPRVRISREAPVPFVTGLGTKTILIPRSLLEVLDEEALDLVLVHELVHVKRRDVELAFLCSLARIPFLLHPIARWLANEIALAREQAVDAIVAKDDPRTYARVLVEVAAHSCGQACRAPVAMSGSSLAQRIDRLSEPASRQVHRATMLLLALALAAGALLAPIRAESTTRLISCEEVDAPPTDAVLECVDLDYEACDTCEACP